MTTAGLQKQSTTTTTATTRTTTTRTTATTTTTTTSTRRLCWRTCKFFFLFLVAMITTTIANATCPSYKFGRRCQLTCHCENSAVCGDATGRCPGACMRGWSGPNCQTHNVALGMPTEMRTPDWSKGARAVDGDLKTCVTSASNRTGWWKVDMQMSQPVFFMEILFANASSRSGRIRVHVSDYVDTFWGKPCTRIHTSHKRSNFSCDIPSTGRYFGIVNKFGQVTFCEVRVFVCANFTFGVDCSGQCNCADPNEICNPVTGFCDSECEDGWTGDACQNKCQGRYGNQCRQPCGHCRKSYPCDHVTGVCPSGCAPGWRGGRCIHECERGRYGEACAHECQHCLENATCDHMTGTCPWRCNPGWKGQKCDSTCRPGNYGQNCQFPCGHCHGNSHCDRETGVCPIGCKSGYSGLFCTQGCLPDEHGVNCQKKCGNCFSPSCDSRTGHCDDQGCLPGWTGVKCNAPCPGNSFGPSCLHSCGHCQGPCDPVDGSCRVACKPGWKGSSCMDKCGNKTFGALCSMSCGQCADGAVCHHVTGLCPHTCKSFYKPPMCQIYLTSFSDRVIRPNLFTLLTACIAVFVCLILAIMLCFVVKQRRRSRHNNHKYAAPPVQHTTV